MAGLTSGDRSRRTPMYITGYFMPSPRKVPVRAAYTHRTCNILMTACDSGLKPRPRLALKPVHKGQLHFRFTSLRLTRPQWPDRKSCIKSYCSYRVCLCRAHEPTLPPHFSLDSHFSWPRVVISPWQVLAACEATRSYFVF